MPTTDIDTICAIATSPGKSGVGIVRISGPSSKAIASKILGFSPEPRHAYYSEFLDSDSSLIDRGIAIFFESPNSFTGEDILELQCHGGFFIPNSLLKATLGYGARLARPGEFSERSFINSKMDLTQVEAIADLIDASTEQAARSALRTLEGEFSRLVYESVEKITNLRIYLEASIDFTDEDIDFLSEGKTTDQLESIITTIESVFSQAKQGAILKEGMSVAIAGKPNAGKSSLLNSMSGKDSAIVTNIPGTTRDVLTELIDIDGLPVHIVDTAGLRDSVDIVEQEGIRRARDAISKADMVILVIDYESVQPSAENILSQFEETGLPLSMLESGKVLVLFNKIDLVKKTPSMSFTVAMNGQELSCIQVSAKTGAGIELLREQLKSSIGFNATEQGSFMARQRHIDALNRSKLVLGNALAQLKNSNSAELVAEDLRMAQKYLGEITGEVTTDDLLGKIFSSFCVGK